MGNTFNTGRLINGLFTDASGNVGLGTTNPLTKLDSQISATGTATVNAAFRDSSTNGNALQIWNGNNEARFRAIYYGTASNQSITFWTITSAGVEGERVRISHNGYVGIGTSSPEGLLHVGSSSAAAVTTPTSIVMDGTYRNSTPAFDKLKFYLYKSFTETYGFGLGGNADIQYWAGASNDGKHVFYTSQTERVRIAADGKLGIGTSSPNFMLSVSYGADVWHAAFGDVTSTGKMVRIGGMGGSGTYGIIGAYTGFTNGSPLPLIFQRDGGGVGIGLTNPTGQLSLKNQISAGSTAPTSYAATQGQEGQNFLNGYYVSGSDNLGPFPRYFDIVSIGSPDGSNGGSNIRFFTNPVAASSPAVERMRITSAGGVMIGTTAADITSYHTVGIAKDGAFSGDVTYSQLAICGVSDSRKRISMGYDTTNNYGYIVCGQFNVQWTGLYLQKASGAVYAGSARIDNNSDIRVKDNIQPITGALDKVLSMTGKKFHMIDEPEGKIRLGFIAQELQGVVDELIIESDRTQKLPNGEIVENVLGLETWGSSWAALLVEAIKELKTEIDILKNK
jgi:hypothetical protein